MTCSLRCLKRFGITLFLISLMCPVAIGFGSTDFHIAPSASSEIPVVAVNPENSTAEQGQHFTINFSITDAVDVYQWSFELWWSIPRLLDIDKMNITEGSFLKSGGNTLFSKAVFTSSGFYILATCSLQGIPGPMPWEPKPQSGNGTLASAVFKVIGPGGHALELRNARMQCWNSTSEELYEVIPTVKDGAFYTTQPVSKFTYSPDPKDKPEYFGRPLVGETVTFNGSESYDADQLYKGQTGTGIESYEWDFDDGNVTTVSTPVITHAYDENGTYNVKLTVVDDEGQSHHWEHFIKINLHDVAIIDVTVVTTEVRPGDVAKVNATVLNQGNFEETLNVTLSVNGSPVNTTLFMWYRWISVPGGGYWSPTASLKAGENGTTTINWNTTGFPKGAYAVTVNASIINPSNRTWIPDIEQDLADNTLVDGDLTVGFHDVAITNVTRFPTTAITGDLVNVNVTIVNEGSYNETFDVTAYYDGIPFGQVSIELTAETSTIHTFILNTTFVGEGVYNITAKASVVPSETDTDDNTYMDGNVTVTRPSGVPVANFTYLPPNPIVSQEVTFNATAYDEDGYIVGWEWDFGDGSIDTGEEVTHAYEEFGDYVVTLIVTDNNTLASGRQRLIIVRGYPVANFTISPEKPLVSKTVTFDASISKPEGGSILSYEWDFGDGTSEIYVGANLTAIASHTYPTFGEYSVTLNVTDSEDLNNSTSKLMVVHAPPVANFTFSPFENPMRTEPIIFNASASYDLDGEIVSYGWDFGDGTSEIYVGANLTVAVTHVYEEKNLAGYEVTLNVTDDDGITGTYIISNLRIYSAHDIAVINLTLSQNAVFFGDTVDINVTVKNEGDPLGFKERTFQVTVSYGDILLGNESVTDLASGAEETLAFSWVTTGVDPGTHTIEAIAHTKSREINTTNNELTSIIAILGISKILISASPTTITAGQTTTISGTISPARPDIDVAVRYRSIAVVGWNTLDITTTDSTGSYQYVWLPSTGGTYEVVASVLLDSTIHATSAAVTIVVNKMSSTVTIDASSTAITVGAEVVLNGTITPIRQGVTVTLNYRMGDEAWSELATVTTDLDGHFSHAWQPPDAGAYEIKAGWPGDERTMSAESDVIVIEVGASQDILLYAGAAAAVGIIAVALFYFLRVRKPKEIR